MVVQMPGNYRWLTLLAVAKTIAARDVIIDSLTDTCADDRKILVRRNSLLQCCTTLLVYIIIEKVIA